MRKPKNYLDAYTIVIDWLQWGDEMDEKKADMALKLIAHYRELNRQLSTERDAALAKLEKAKEALTNLMEAHRVVFREHMFPAFRAGKTNFNTAWLDAEKILEAK